MIQWLSDNKTWVFSGIGVAVLGVLWRLFRSPTQVKVKQKQRVTAKGGSVQQAGGDIINMVSPQPQPHTLRVLAHRAIHLGNGLEHFFIKIINTTPGVDVEVTHVWYDNGAQRFDHLDPQLPARIRPNQTWETFIPVTRIPQDADVFRHFHAILSTEEQFRSEHNVNVPPAGRIARH